MWQFQPLYVPAGAAPGGLSIPIAAYHHRRRSDVKFIRQGATHKVVIGPAVAVGDGFTPVTTLAVSSADEAEVILHDNATVVDISGYTFAAIATADGYYHLTLQSGISNTVGHMTVVINDDSLILPIRQDFCVLEEATYDMLFAGSALGYIANAPVNVAQVSGDATAADTLELFAEALDQSTGQVDSGTFAAGAIDAAAIADNAIDAGAIAADAITAAKIANGAIDAATFAADVDAEILSYVVDDATRIDASALNTASGAIGSNGSGLTEAGGTGDQFTAVPWNASWDAEVQSEAEDAIVAHRLDELLNADSDIDGAAPPTVGSVFHELMSKTAGSFTFDQTTDSQEALRDRGDAAWITATGFSTHSAADVWAAGTRTLTAGTNIDGSTFTAIPWNASWDAEVQSEVDDALVAQKLDHLVAVADADDVVDNSIIAKLASKGATADWSSFVNTTDALEALRDRGDAAWVTATGFATVAALATAQADLDILTGADGATLATSQPNYAPATATALASLVTTVGVAGAGLTEAGGTGDHLTAVVWNAAWDAEVQSEVVDALTAEGYTSTRAAYLDELAAANIPADVDQLKADLPGKLTKNTAFTNFMFKMVDSTDHVTAETGLTVTATRSLDGAAFASCANSVSEVASGWYKLDLAAGDLNGNIVVLRFTANGADISEFTIITQPT